MTTFFVFSWPKENAMSDALTIGCTIGLGLYVVGMIALLQLQWHKLKCSDTDTALTSGLARTVMELLTETPNPDRVASLLERNRFRSIKVCAYLPNGDVLLDSASPCSTEGLKPATASQRQTELFKAVQGAEDRKGNAPRQTTSGTLYRSCDAHGSGDPQLTTFSSVRSPQDMVVVATSCGYEN